MGTVKPDLVFNIATIQRRRTSFIAVLKSLAAQNVKCDRINIAMSYGAQDIAIESLVKSRFKSYEIIYGQFPAEKKMFGFSQANPDSYFLTVDDDIIYPADYSRLIIDGIEKYKRKAVVGFHGIKFDKFPVVNYKAQKTMYQYFQEVKEDTITHTIGTGVCGLYVDTLRKAGFDLYRLNNSVNTLDGSLGKFLRDNKIDMVVLKHTANHIRIYPGSQDNQALWKKSSLAGNKDKLKWLQ